MENSNGPDYLEKIKVAVIENLRHTAAVPSVQMQDVPSHPLGGMTDEEEAELDDLDEDENRDVRVSERQWEKNIRHEADFGESEDEDLARAHRPKLNGSKRTFDDYRHSDMEVDSGVASPANGTNEETTKEPEDHQPADGHVNGGDGNPEPAKVDADGDVGMEDDTTVETAAIKTEEVEAKAVVEDASTDKVVTESIETNEPREDDTADAAGSSSRADAADPPDSKTKGMLEAEDAEVDAEKGKEPDKETE